ncbi:Fizzy-related like protein [Astathelohania contejeani]|uniref:Fizzy-related like protein n=1 Tax=Astathelohania contejeani TaxID=164912 RepID=A0ABQ7HYI7_9MICR|nr:Fizzy-related like protein [Thelohania contejeani]
MSTLHSQEVCGLRLSGSSLASGGNDNRLFIYDTRKMRIPVHRLTHHRAAVKALAWSPTNPRLLLSGGGTADKTIKMWDTGLSEPLLRSIDSGSQVCGLHWCKDNQVISTHGYSQNDARISSQSSLRPRVSFQSHRNRVIHFAVSEDEKYFVTGSSDNILNFWEIKNENKKFFR